MARPGSVHEGFMRRALGLARKGSGRTSPNPAVGAVIVRGGQVIAGGWHRRAGLPHAEVEALSKAPANLKRAVMYVTLEPCTHFGRTPPCVDAVVRSGIKNVVIGTKDPNPRVSGEGIRRLKAAGIKVTCGVLEDECRALNEAYIKFITTGMPLVTLKLASSLDGRIATAAGESKWITGLAARRLVHKMRSSVDAVVVGSGTVVKDDPELTVRHLKGRDPLRVVLDSRFSVPLSARVLRAGPGLRAPIVFTTRAASARKMAEVRKAGVEAVVVPASRDGVSLKRVLKELGGRGVASVLLEGGGTLAASFIKAGLVDRFSLFMAPVIIGKEGRPSVGGLGLKRLKNAPLLDGATVRRVDKDLLIEGRLEKRP